MRSKSISITLGLAVALAAISSGVARADDDDHQGEGRGHRSAIQVGPRPFYLVEGLEDGRLKDKLSHCKDGPFVRTNFSIGHRGAALQFPEHSKEAYEAGARLGAGLVECDTTLTKDT